MSSRRRTLQHYARGRSSYFKGSHVPIKRELFMYVEVPILTGSSKVKEQLGPMTSVGASVARTHFIGIGWHSLVRTHLYRNFPT
jgi:hypothetical protein